jgi:hypothetical protein
MRPSPRNIARRRGSVYLLVLAAGMSLTVMCVAGLALAKSQRQTEELRHCASGARLMAQAGQELGVATIQADPGGSGSWRKFATATVFDGPLGSGTASVTLADPDDATLADSITERVLVRSEARIGPARQIVQQTFDPVVESLPCLLTAAWSGSALTFSGGSAYSDGVIGSNGAVTASSASVNAPVAGSTVSGSAYNGTTLAGVPALTLPGSGAVSTWAARGTAISYVAIGGTLRGCVLSPGSNPYGATNPQGIYVINCAGSALTVRDCRVNGTLIILNAGSGSRFRDGVFLEGRAGQPALILTGQVSFEMQAGDVLESVSGNLNPAGSPYQGASDSDAADQYPSMIVGVAYATGNVTVATGTTLSVKGCLLVGGTLTVQGTLRCIQVTPPSPIESFLEVTRYAGDPETLERVVE